MQDQNQEDEINLLEYWDVLWRRKKMISLVFLLSVVLAMVVSLLLPKYYKSETIIMPNTPDAGGLGAALSSIPLAGALVGAAGLQTPADKVMVILKSRTLAETVINKFDLLRVFYDKEWDSTKGVWKDPDDHPVMQEAVKKLTENVVDISKSKEGAIRIDVVWKDPRLTADIANYYVSALTQFMNEKSVNMTISVVDRAIPAEKKYRPKIALNMALAGFLSLFLGVFIAFFLEYLSRKRRA